MKYLPLRPETLLIQLHQVHQHRGLPAPQSIEIVRTGAFYEALITDSSGTRRRILVANGDLLPGGLFGAVHAARWLQSYPEIPMAGPYLLLPIGCLDIPAIYSPVPTGETLFRPEQIGRVIRTLPAVAAHGGGAHAHAMHPLTASWAGDYRALAERWVALARAGGTAIQPVVDQMLGKLTPRALELDGPPALVPAEVRPYFDGDRLTHVGGWELSWAGDRLSALGPYLHHDASTLARLGRGLGVSLLPRIDSLRAYAAGSVLLLLAQAAAAIGAHERVELLSTAINRAAALETLEDRLRAAELGKELSHPTAPDRTAPLAMMDRLLRQPLVSDTTSWRSLAGTVLWCQQVADRHPSAHTVALSALRHLEAGGEASVGLPSLPVNSEPHGQVLAWLGAGLKKAAGGAPEGFDGALAALSYRNGPPKNTAHQQLIEALLATTAAAARGGDPTSLSQQLRAACAEAPISPDPNLLLERVEAKYAQPEAWAEERTPVGLVLYALNESSILLPGSAERVLSALEVGG